MNHRDNESATSDSNRDTAVALSDSESAALKIRQEIGARLTKIRGQGTNQTEFAKRFGVHKNTYAAWERGERDIDASALRVLALEGWSPMWVLTGEDGERLPATIPPDAAVDTALVVGRNDKEAEARREARFQGIASGLRMAEEIASQSHSQPVRPEQATLDPELLGKAVRMVDAALMKRGIRHLVDSGDFGNLARIVYDDLAHGRAEDAASAGLESVLNIARSSLSQPTKQG